MGYQIKLYHVLLCFLGVSIGCQSAAAVPCRQGPSALEKCVLSSGEFDSIIESALEAFHVPGASVGLVVDGQIVLSKGYGTCKAGEELPVTDRTLFPIASCTKAFTALLLGQLVDEGKITFDDPVVKYIPELSLFDPEATVHLTLRDLLAHRSGLARHDPIWIFSEMTRSDVVPLLRHLEPACGLRDAFMYNNYMYALAGIVVERLTGLTWEDAVASRLFKPLAMDDSNTTLDQLVTSPDYSFPHADLEGKLTVLSFRNALPVNPGIGINSTVADMAKWVKLQLGQEEAAGIIQSGTLREMHTVQMPIPPASSAVQINQSGYGLGWYCGQYRGHDAINHGGDIEGFASDVTLLPAEGVGLVILTNSSTDGRFAISVIKGCLLDRLLGKNAINWMETVQAARNEARVTLEQALENVKKESLTTCPEAVLNEYVGTYQHPSYGTVRIDSENGQPRAVIGSMALPLYFQSEDLFTSRLDLLLVYGINPCIDITILRDAAGNVQGLEIPLEKFRSVKPIIFTKAP